ATGLSPARSVPCPAHRKKASTISGKAFRFNGDYACSDALVDTYNLPIDHLYISTQKMNQILRRSMRKRKLPTIKQ
ncbi:MAG: hypothetical protein Q4A59_06040, partial [Erysipelotrichaceae bacterium]|nr:hypothetical protein [Erysipelotrichaceae bacterium]